METQELAVPEVLVDYDPDLLSRVVAQAKGRDGTRFETQTAHQAFGRTEAQPVLPEGVIQTPKVNIFRSRGDDEVVMVPLFIAEEEVLAVRSPEVGPVLVGVLNRENRRMLVPDIRNPEPVQDVQDFLLD